MRTHTWNAPSLVGRDALAQQDCKSLKHGRKQIPGHRISEGDHGFGVSIDDGFDFRLELYRVRWLSAQVCAALKEASLYILLCGLLTAERKVELDVREAPGGANARTGVRKGGRSKVSVLNVVKT